MQPQTRPVHSPAGAPRRPTTPLCAGGPPRRRPRISSLVLLGFPLALALVGCRSEEPHALEAVRGLAETYDLQGRRQVARVFGPDARVGKGVALGDGRWILTGAHLVGGADTLRVQDVDGGEEAARVVALDEAHGLALLRTETLRLEPARLELEAVPASGEEIYLMVEDDYVGLAPGSGQITGRRSAAAGDLLRLSGLVPEEEQGGAVFDHRYRVVGLVLADSMLDGSPRSSYAQAVPQLLEFLEEAGGPTR